MSVNATSQECRISLPFLLAFGADKSGILRGRIDCGQASLELFRDLNDVFPSNTAKDGPKPIKMQRWSRRRIQYNLATPTTSGPSFTRNERR